MFNISQFHLVGAINDIFDRIILNTLNIPKIYSYTFLVMEKINVYECWNSDIILVAPNVLFCFFIKFTLRDYI